ncbi:alpha/beta hydrolase [Cellulomonas sp. RIT-PI-Y]|uniref:alpha/beta hydrolase n=1 Tax=Cellulomonas sp. RIT-PI-Y TaxID=3035297 RepID=UPI0021D94039|nr:alpha/beta hydrolase [Cellulomonas sp. RIT-PI-Y]
MTVTQPSTTAATRTWSEPEHLAPRGTLVLLVGRGETPEVYQRFGSRIAADAYRVIAVDDDPAAPATAAALLADDTLPGPHVLIGSDAGALTAVQLVRDGARPDAVVLAGLPVRPGPLGQAWGGSWESEVAARTACPNHRAVLARSARGGIAEALRTALPIAPVAPGTLGVPTLALHGAADPISPAPEAVPVLTELGAEVSLVADGLHDVLNDVQHRSVAATVVLFLERLRAGGVIVSPA